MRLRVKIGIFKKVPLCANFIIGAQHSCYRLTLGNQRFPVLVRLLPEGSSLQQSPG